MINVSLGVTWVDSISHLPRKPGTYAQDDSVAHDAVTDLMNGIVAGQTDFHDSSAPLIVIAAGNFEYNGAASNTDAYWAVMPQLKDSLPGRVIVVGASDRSRNVAWFSGANAGGHSYVDLMAPGDSIVFLDHTTGVDRDGGTSYSAPLVTAAAGLLMSFDPTIVTPAQLRQLILDGADSNSTPGGAVRRAGTYRFLSLYKPLVLAAKRKGAPLCRNRIWLDSNRVVVRRSASLVDTIFTGNIALITSLLVTYHGGNRVDITTYGQSQNDLSLLYQNGTWSAQPRAPLAGYSESGASQSYSSINTRGIFGRSHSGDSVANFRWVGPYNVFNGGTAQIFIQDSAGTGAGRNLTTLPHTGPFVLALAYSPRGDAVFAATGWSWGGYAPPEQITIEYWRVPLNGSPATRIWESPTRYLEASLTVSEDGTELATDIESYLPGTIFGGYNCWTEYRSAFTGVRLDSVTANRVSPHDGVCGWDRHSGSSARVVQQGH